jgi:hypothetical protein
MTGLHPAEIPAKQRRRRAARRKNHYAKSLDDAKYRPKIVESKKVSSRKQDQIDADHKD